MCDALKRVLYRVGKVVHREDAPLGALTVMLNVADAVEHGIAHVEIAAGEVNLCAQSVAALFKFTVFHAFKEVEAFLDGPVAPGTDSGMRCITAVLLELVGRELTDVCKTFLDELYGVLIGFFKVI